MSCQYYIMHINEITNYLIAVPKYKYRSEENGSASINNVILKYCIPDYMIMVKTVHHVIVHKLINYS